MDFRMSETVPAGLLHEAELDALAEACNIGMGHAATALSQLTGKGVDIQAPRLQVVDGAGLGSVLNAEPVRALSLQILGNVRGSILILLKEANARRMLELLLGSAPGEPFTALEVDTLKEVGNIVASACLNALGIMLKMTLLPSVPTLFSGETPALFARLVDLPAGSEPVVMIDTVFSISEAFCGGSVFLLPAPESIAAIVGALGAKQAAPPSPGGGASGA